MPFQASKFQEILSSKALQERWLFFLLLFLPLLSFVSIHMGLLTAFVFTFVVPGLIFCRFFRLKSYEIIVFIPIFSVLLSTQLIYYLSLVFGYSRETILFSFLALTAVYGLVNSRTKEAYPLRNFLKVRKFSKTLLLIFFLFLFFPWSSFTEASGLKMSLE